MSFSPRVLLATFAGLALVAAACGTEDTTAADDTAADDTAAGDTAAGDTAADTERPTVVASTTILGDVVENLVGDEFEVVTIMPTGADPHDFQASAQQVAQMSEADVLVVNGGGFEEGLLDVIEAAEGDGVPVFDALSSVDTIEFSEGEHSDEEHSDEEHSDEEHSDEEHSDEEHSHEEHSHDGADPHFWADPARMAVAADAVAEFLVVNVEGIDADALTASTEAYVAELEAIDIEVVETLSPIDDENRVLVSNHDSFGYFADRYEFEIAGTVIPSGSTNDGTSAEALAELVEVIESEGVPAIFAETTVSDELAQTLAGEVGGDIAIVTLYTGSLGEPGSDGDTYLAMVRTNAQRIADALAG